MFTDMPGRVSALMCSTTLSRVDVDAVGSQGCCACQADLGWLQSLEPEGMCACEVAALCCRKARPSYSAVLLSGQGAWVMGD